MWEQVPSDSLRTWSTALTYANNLTLGGHTDWRLANIRELQSLINAAQSNPASWLNSLEFSGVGSSDYWSSNTSPADFNMACVLQMNNCGFGESRHCASRSLELHDGCAEERDPGGCRLCIHRFFLSQCPSPLLTFSR
jgi:hypothetical protein